MNKIAIVSGNFQIPDFDKYAEIKLVHDPFCVDGKTHLFFAVRNPEQIMYIKRQKPGWNIVWYCCKCKRLTSTM